MQGKIRMCYLYKGKHGYKPEGAWPKCLLTQGDFYTGMSNLLWLKALKSPFVFKTIFSLVCSVPHSSLTRNFPQALLMF